ncbi:transcription factor [Cryptococcus neoformans C23]|uniref:Transcription factor n=2 Tax=Cryptococcus neoformans TaxID=5207 RepID=A0A854QDS5_CRYNE|nr:transcription factor [Cryptococcus neoformans var. grubii H99]AUB25005.1 transcription factor [Cryptococcus neoformans var. grubii]OWZ31828.1 transcription factor [Cryptococcus neoformans var. grubii AD2-60a]OWZ43903.1 transcription factor [Cryptococcus neoformans var. grubii C23]OWZ54642.1 transcription factor [Cryptococcus neoformans var. grubii 125.91]OXC84636.1 transcription factor [Cryptococcus neoformans var. grubii AD1-7a]OXG21316.1 transcription factor [Cryptococcus neoformans var.|eukprot:XP_012049135.1 transcription factor [Cryptococcus neoformans var. grubii H99]
MYTTACEACRKVRMKCIRPSRGYDMSEICERCRTTGIECITVKRRVGRQPGVKNRKRKADAIDEQAGASSTSNNEAQVSRDVDHLPNPLHVLASEAIRRHSTPEAEEATAQDNSYTRSSKSIFHRYSDWTDKIQPEGGKEAIMRRLDSLLLSKKPIEMSSDVDEPSVFCGRIDMARPDASPEHDVISLQIISLAEAQHLFDSFMELITNGSMYFDPRLHTLPFVRSRSSFLLAVILAIASTYKSICPSARLHTLLMSHAHRLENVVRNNHLKSTEIIQGLLLLASWTEIPSTLARDRTWMFVSHALALVVELRLDTALPYCVQTDPLYDKNNHDLLVRNAHRVCFLMYIHDRNMAMVAGRHPIFRDSALVSPDSLAKWGKHPLAHRFDAAICASVSLRKLVTSAHARLSTQNYPDFASGEEYIDRSMAEWRRRWSYEIQSTHEYDIIARFSAFVLALTLVKKRQLTGQIEREARRACEVLAFDVVCAAIHHYKTWNGLLNSATFDTSMVAFCAIYTIQSINHSASPYLSDLSLLRLATVHELIGELEAQADARHAVDIPGYFSVVDAMARQLSRNMRLLLSKKEIYHAPHSETSVTHSSTYNPHTNFIHTHPHLHHLQDPHHYTNNQLPQFDEVPQFMFTADDGGLPFMGDWGLEGMLPDMDFGIDTGYSGSDPGGTSHEMTQGVNMQHMLNLG